MKRTFFDRVYTIVEQIPEGKVSTYKDIACIAGSPGAARAVGTAMKNNPNLSKIPCHRVVGSDGAMHGYSAGAGVPTKIKKLKAEGVIFNGQAINLEKSRWDGSIPNHKHTR